MYCTLAVHVYTLYITHGTIGRAHMQSQSIPSVTYIECSHSDVPYKGQAIGRHHSSYKIWRLSLGPWHGDEVAMRAAYTKWLLRLVYF